MLEKHRGTGKFNGLQSQHKSINFLCDAVLPCRCTEKGCDLSNLSSYLMPCGILLVIFLPICYMLVVSFVTRNHAINPVQFFSGQGFYP